MTIQCNKRVLLGVTGGIAAYKSADLVRRLRAAGAEIRVVMTKAAAALVTPLTFQALCGHAVIIDWDKAESEFAMDHIALTRWADVLVIAPLTADFMAKLAHGFAGDVLSTLCLAATKPIFLAPAMNQQMWHNAATQANKKLLVERGMRLIGPDTGSQACGDNGEGRMLEPVAILTALSDFFNGASVAAGLKILITAGPTREAIDPVRYLSNQSSGKMGYALAQSAVEMGATVTLISGPTQLPCPAGINYIGVDSAQQMQAAVLANIETQDILISTAAVADYKCQAIAKQKIKKHGEQLTLTLVATPDILKAVSVLAKRPFVVGFAAETENIILNAQQKLIAKKLDMIAANDVSQPACGFNADENALTVLWKNGEEIFTRQPKKQLAEKLLGLIIKLYRESQR